ncbi:MAG: hypothetical protein KatS3mg111_2815 [Pirellulaceae bacterium]|nr:MAG: hypothetical protein KatS3mg111_2815 [Pirellulaceae bacterium]
MGVIQGQVNNSHGLTVQQQAGSMGAGCGFEGVKAEGRLAGMPRLAGKMLFGEPAACSEIGTI